MKIIAEYEVPERLREQALEANRDGDMSWLWEIASECFNYTARVVE